MDYYGFYSYNNDDNYRFHERLRREEELEMRRREEEPFHKYFLDAQNKGEEVYLGLGVALVVYEDGTVGVQTQEPEQYSAVFLSRDLMNDEDRRFLEEIRKPENRRGIKKELTDKLLDFYGCVAFYHDSEDGNCVYLAMVEMGLRERSI